MKILSLVTRASVTPVSATVSVTRSLLVSANAPWACSLCDVKVPNWLLFSASFPEHKLLIYSSVKTILDLFCQAAIELFDADLLLLQNQSITE